MKSAREAIERELGRPLQVELAGKVVVEKNGRTFLVMFPDGEIVRERSEKAVGRLISRRHEREAKRLGADALVGIVEWRD